MTCLKLFAVFTVLAILPLCFACKSSPPETGKPYLWKLRIEKGFKIWFFFQEVITKLEVILIWIGKEVALEVQAKLEEISEDQVKPAQTMAFKLKALSPTTLMSLMVRLLAIDFNFNLSTFSFSWSKCWRYYGWCIEWKPWWMSRFCWIESWRNHAFQNR